MRRYIFTHNLNSNIVITILSSSFNAAMQMLLCTVRDIDNFTLSEAEIIDPLVIINKQI